MHLIRGNHSIIVLACGSLLLCGLAGCVVAIGNETAEKGPRDGRVTLTADERATVPTVESRSELPTIRERYGEPLSKLGPTTSVDEFKTLFPDAKFIERKDLAGIDAYSLETRQKYRYRGSSYGYVLREEAWFYFKNGVFVKWGAPRDWP